MNNKLILICIAIFLFVTVFALTLDTNSSIHQVRISTKDIALNNESANVLSDKNVNLKLNGANVSSTTLGGTNQGVNIDTSSGISSGNVNFKTSDIDYKSQGSYVKYDNDISYKNIDNSKIDAALKEADNITNQRLNSQKPRERRYTYKDIDWSKWKSNFVNQILDDSLQIRELDNYNEGDWLSYSFTVDKSGRIRNISVISPVVNKLDRDVVARLIKSYEMQDITLFPPNSKRTVARVSAVMILSSTTKKSTPKDFNERERVKVEY